MSVNAMGSEESLSSSQVELSDANKAELLETVKELQARAKYAWNLAKNDPTSKNWNNVVISYEQTANFYDGVEKPNLAAECRAKAVQD